MYMYLMLHSIVDIFVKICCAGDILRTVSEAPKEKSDHNLLMEVFIN